MRRHGPWVALFVLLLAGCRATVTTEDLVLPPADASGGGGSAGEGGRGEGGLNPGVPGDGAAGQGGTGGHGHGWAGTGTAGSTSGGAPTFSAMEGCLAYEQEALVIAEQLDECPRFDAGGCVLFAEELAVCEPQWAELFTCLVDSMSTTTCACGDDGELRCGGCDAAWAELQRCQAQDDT